MTLDHTTTIDSILKAVSEIRERPAIAPMFLPRLEELDTDIWDLVEAIEDNETNHPEEVNS